MKNPTKQNMTSNTIETTGTAADSKSNLSPAADLLEALQFLLADYIAINGPELTGSNEPLNRALAAIAKAKGMTPGSRPTQE